MRKVFLGMVVVYFVMMTTVAYGVGLDPGLDKKGGGEVVDDEGFRKSATAFFNETKTFTAESKLLIDNTQEVDTALLNLETALSVPSKVATALKTLDNTLANIKQMIVVAKQVPQTRAKAEQLEKNVDAIKPSVAKAAETAARLDKAVEPVRIATNKTEIAVSTALDYEIVFRTFALTYFDGINKVIACSNVNPTIKAKTQKGTIKILDGSTASFKVIDTGIIKVNQTYASTVAMPEKALKATISEISEQIKQLEPILTSVNGLQDKLKTLNNTLAELRKVLDQSIGFSFDYPCGPKICTQSTPYPCGTKMCDGGKYAPDYPCAKICYEEVPYVCGVKTCSEGVSMSLSTVINGADEIETKIESLLSSTAWKALKTIGVKKYVDDLIKHANSLTNPVLSKLNLDIAMTLPDMNITLNTGKLDASIPQFTAIDNPMTQIGNSIDMKNPLFAPDIAKLQLLDKDNLYLVTSSGCLNQAKPLTPPQPPKRMNWRKLLH